MCIGCSDGDVKSKKLRYCRLFSCLGLWFPAKCWALADEVLGCRRAYHYGKGSRRNYQGRAPVEKEPKLLAAITKAERGETPSAADLFKQIGRFELDVLHAPLSRQLTTWQELPRRIDGFGRHVASHVVRIRALEASGNLLRRGAPS
jgi:hypothetical protein